MSVAPTTLTLSELTDLLHLTPSSRIALVGNAKSLFGQHQGPEIDQYDCVVRLNYGRITDPIEQGSRTDVLGCSDDKITLSWIANELSPKAVVWLTSKATEAHFWDAELAVHLNTLAHWQAAANYVEPYRPSSGAIAAYLLKCALGVQQVTLFGFDFFDTPTFYHRKSLRFWRKPKPSPHSGAAERSMMQKLGIEVR